MTERKYSWLVISTFAIGLLVLIFGYKLFGPEQPKVGPLTVSVVDTNGYLLPYVRVEIKNLNKGYESSAQNFGRYFDGPFYEGNHQVIVKLGEHSEEMNKEVYNKVHNFTKDMTSLSINLGNVRQRFNIEVAKQGVEIPVLPYSEWNGTSIKPYKNQYTERQVINAPVELRVFDEIENIFRTDVDSLLSDFRYVTFIRQEYPEGKWVYYVIFTNSSLKPHEMIGTMYHFIFPTPNVIFSVSQDMSAFNELRYSSQFLNIHGFTIVQTTFETKDFLTK